MSTEARDGCVVPECVCVLLYGVWLKFINRRLWQEGTVNEAGPLPLLLKLKGRRDLHGNESVSRSLTRLQMDRTQISISSFNPFDVPRIRKQLGQGAGSLPLWPHNPRVDFNNNEALMDKWSPISSGVVMMALSLFIVDGGEVQRRFSSAHIPSWTRAISSFIIRSVLPPCQKLVPLLSDSAPTQFFSLSFHFQTPRLWSQQMSTKPTSLESVCQTLRRVLCPVRPVNRLLLEMMNLGFCVSESTSPVSSSTTCLVQDEFVLLSWLSTLNLILWSTFKATKVDLSTRGMKWSV